MPTTKKTNQEDPKEIEAMTKPKKTAKRTSKKNSARVKSEKKPAISKKRKTSSKKIIKKQPTKELNIDIDEKNEESLTLGNFEKKDNILSDIELGKEEIEQEPPRVSAPMFLRKDSKNKAKNLVISSIEEGERGYSTDENEEEDREELVKEKKDINMINNNYDNNMENISSTSGRSVKLYRKIAVSFIFLTLILIAVIFYFSFVKVTIILEPNQERVSSNFIFDVNNEGKSVENSANSAVNGVVEAMVIEDEGIYPSTGETTIGEQVVGKVKIINNYTKNQPLVATTRLLTPDNKLFRIEKTVNVPAGGSIEVEIYADKPSQEMAIEPSKFIIPGLWAGLQDIVYAESYEKFEYAQKIEKYIIQSDIDNAIFDLKKKLVAKAKKEVNEKFNDYDQVLFEIDENSIVSDADGKVKDKVDEFNVSVRASVLVVAFNDEKIVNLAEQKFILVLQENREVVEFNKDDIVYTLNNYDKEAKSASINATFEGKAGVKDGTKIIEIEKILGLNEKQLEVYLSSISEISSFEVRFFPSFVKKVPKLVDRINIEVKN